MYPHKRPDEPSSGQRSFYVVMLHSTGEKHDVCGLPRVNGLREGGTKIASFVLTSGIRARGSPLPSSEGQARGVNRVM